MSVDDLTIRSTRIHRACAYLRETLRCSDSLAEKSAKSRCHFSLMSHSSNSCMAISAGLKKDKLSAIRRRHPGPKLGQRFLYWRNEYNILYI